MEVKNTPISELIPYARNPRKNDAAVDKVEESKVTLWQTKPTKPNKQSAR